MASLLLTTDTHDITIDNSGNLALVEDSATNAAEKAQNVATACLVWKGEGYWDTNFGVPYTNIFGNRPPLGLIMEYMATTALTVSGVNDVSVDIAEENKEIKGTILINNGEANVNI